MNAKKILVVIESIDIDDSSATKGRLALINNLVKAGNHLKVYHYTRKNIDLSAIDCVRIEEQKTSKFYWLTKLQRLIWKVFRININPFFEKQLGFTFSFFNDVYSIKKALEKDIDFKPDWVLTLSKAASFRSHMAVLKLPKLHAKWLAFIHDPYPMHFYPRPYNWVEPGYYQKQEFFREVSKKARYSIFPSKLLKEWMSSYYIDFDLRGLVIPHQISDIVPITQKLPSYFKKDSFTILHAGSLMKPRNPEALIEGFKMFIDKNNDAKEHTQLLLIGKQKYYKEYLENKQNHINQLYVSSGYVNYEDVYQMQNSASVNVILEAKSEISPFLPGKFPHCVKANKPILYLGPKLSECSRLLGDNYPYSTDINNAKKIAIYIEKMYTNWKERNEQQYLVRPDLVDYLSSENLKSIINNL